MAHKLNTTDEGVAAQLQYDTIALVLKMFGMMGGLFLVIAVYKRWEKRKALAKKPSRAILDDDEAASRGLEMGEMNSAAEEAAAAEEGSVSVGDAPRGGMEGVRDELTKLRMSKYAAVFEENGYDHWPEILRLPTYRLNKLVEIVGMSTNHADRFKEALRVQRRQLHVQQLMPSADAGDSCVIL